MTAGTDSREPGGEREFGPQASLRRRRIWGTVLIVVVLAFLGGVLTIDTAPTGGRMTFGATDDDRPSPWLFALGAAAVIVVSLTAHRLGGRRDG